MRRISFLFAAIFLLLAACDTHQTDFFHNETSCENTIKDPETVSFVPKDHYDPAHYTGLNIELTFWSESCSEPYGLWGPSADLFTEDPEITVTSDTPDAQADTSINGKYETKTWDGFIVKTFIAHKSEHTNEGFETIYSLVSTRSDIYTYRGIHVGSSLENLISAYQDIGYDLDTWSKEYRKAGFNGELRYTPEEYRGSLAPELIFSLEDNSVKRIELQYEPVRYEF